MLREPPVYPQLAIHSGVCVHVVGASCMPPARNTQSGVCAHVADASCIPPARNTERGVCSCCGCLLYTPARHTQCGVCAMLRLPPVCLQLVTHRAGCVPMLRVPHVCPQLVTHRTGPGCLTTFLCPASALNKCSLKPVHGLCFLERIFTSVACINYF